MGEGEKCEVLDVVLKETVDLENIPIEEVFENLRCSREGLTTQAAEERLVIFGHNKLEEKKEPRRDGQMAYELSNFDGNTQAALLKFLELRGIKLNSYFAEAAHLKDGSIRDGLASTFQSVRNQILSSEEAEMSRLPGSTILLDVFH